MAEMMAEIADRHPSVGECRSIGLFGVMELVKNKETREPLAPFGGSTPEMGAFKNYLLEHGIFLYTHWHTVLLIPPLIITPEQLQEGFSAIDKGLEITDKIAKK
jgi:taurine---2-oxoglutarate transaminase